MKTLMVPNSLSRPPAYGRAQLPVLCSYAQAGFRHPSLVGQKMA